MPSDRRSTSATLAAGVRSVAGTPWTPAACLVAALLAAGACAAQRAALAGRPVLGELAAPLDALLELGRAWGRLLPRLEAARVPLVLASAGGVAFAAWRPRWRALSSAAGALGLAALGQSFLLTGPGAVGVLLMAAAALVWLWRPAAAPPSLRVAPRLEAAGFTLGMAAFLALCLVRIDVRPDLYFDEQAYVEAARQILAGHRTGDIALFPYVATYRVEQFAAQGVPFLAAAAAAAWIDPDLLALRLASTAAATAALGVGYAAVRGCLGRAAALGMLALAAAAPLGLAYARPGFYIAASVLHAACSALATLRFVARPGRRTALLLGALLGGSLYFYQLSWFAPVLCGAAVAAATAGRSPRPVLRPAALALGAAAAVALPGLLGQTEGLEAVSRQTFDRVIGTESDRPVPGTGSPWGNAGSMLARLFAEGGPESAGRAVTAPLLDPWVAPLLALGVAEALRRRREPGARVLLVWTLGAALLPAAATAGGVLPRRAVLVWPLAYGLAALPLLEGMRAARTHGRGPAAIAAGVAGVWLVGAASTGAALYHDAWPHVSLRGERAETTAIGTSVLALARSWRGLDPHLKILLPGHLPGLAGYLVNVEGEAPSTPQGAKHIFPGPGGTSEAVRRRSCSTHPPFAWIYHRDASDRFAGLDRDFHVRVESRGDFRVMWVDAVRPGGCRMRRGRRRPGRRGGASR